MAIDAGVNSEHLIPESEAEFLHKQTALRLKAALLFRPGTVVVNVPYHLREGKEREPVVSN